MPALLYVYLGVHIHLEWNMQTSHIFCNTTLIQQCVAKPAICGANYDVISVKNMKMVVFLITELSEAKRTMSSTVMYNVM